MKSLRQWFASDTSNGGLYDLQCEGHIGRPNVLILPEHLNATYFLSFDVPLRRLHAQGAVNFSVASQQRVAASGTGCWIRWAETFSPDIVIMSRYCSPFGADILRFFRQRGVPVIYHLDDDLLDIPESLGLEIQERHGNPQTVACRRELLQASDLIYASTAYLSEVLERRFPVQHIVHGIYAPYLGEELSPKLAPQREIPVIGYMGSQGHQADLSLAVPAISRLLEERPDLTFEVFGTIRLPSTLLRFGRRVRHIEVKRTYMDFLLQLADLGWHVGLAPLVDTPFNRCKAPTKYIEYTACGIPVVASHMPVYSQVLPKGGGELVTDDWHETINRLLDNSNYRQQTIAAARAYCSSRFSVGILTTQVKSILNRALHEKRSHAC